MTLPTLRKLSVIIPVYNERDAIESVIDRVKASIVRQGLDAEIVVVNDGSKDGSADIIRKIPGIVFIDKVANEGKGSAVRAGIEGASGDLLIIQDADNEYDPDDYTAMIAPIVAGTADLTLGSRFRLDRPVFWGEDKSPYLTHYIGNHLIIWVTNLLYWKSFTDYEGCYKAFSAHLAAAIPIRSKGFEYDNELICKAFRRGLSVVEVPIRYEPRTYLEGKKITWKHGVRMLWTILWCRFLD